MKKISLPHFIKLPKSEPPKHPLFYTLGIAAFLAVAGLALGIAVEWIARGSLSETLDWVTANRSIFILNYYLALAVLLVFYSIIGSLFPALGMTAALLSLFSMITYFKTSLIGEPFFPWDIILNQEGLNIAPLVTSKRAILRIGAAVFVVLALFALRFVLKRYSVAWYIRIAFVSAAVFVLVAFGMQKPWTLTMQYKAGVAHITWNQQESYRNNGQLLAFALNIKNSIISKPTGYGEAAISGIAEQIALRREMPTLADEAAESSREQEPLKGQLSEKQPNVIFIMNEAFWDPTLLPGVTFSEDPIPTVRQLQASNSMPDYFLSPQFGGGTSNVEFEVLTGFSTSFLPNGSVPYQQYISRPLPSLASFFEDKGYKSLAVHPYEGWFWNRNNVYKWLGFEGFKSISHFVEPKYKGAFISDEEASRSIIEQVESSEEPVFIYAVTMQNHGPYNDNRYGDASIAFEGDLTEEARQIINTYTLGARDADESLRMLIEHFENSGEPTFIVFFGDHLPMLGYNYDVYKQGDFIQSSLMEEWSLEELLGMRSTPLAIWSNFPTKGKDGTVISASFLGAYVLDALGMESPGQFAFTADLYPSLPGLLENLAVDQNNNLAWSAAAEYETQLEEYWLLQYDLMFGEQYLAGRIDSDYLNRPALTAYNIMDTLASGK